MIEATPYIERLTIHPIKGLRGVDVDRALITPFGLQDDRRFMLVDADGRFMSQRKHPELTHFGVQIPAVPGEERVFIVSHPDHGSIRIPLSPDVEDASRSEVRIWDDTVVAEQVSSTADAWFTNVLGEEVRLVWMPEDADRHADPDHAPPGHRVNFADGFPILVLGSASIEELNGRLDVPVPIRRFRANVVIGGSEAWAEDGWTDLETDGVRLKLVKPCARCVVITTDQETGERSKEPTATLATYRVRGGKVMVGMNAVAEPSGAHLSVGQHIRVK